MKDTDEERIEKIKTFLSENESINLDNLSLILNKFQQRITDLENKVFLNKDI